MRCSSKLMSNIVGLSSNITDPAIVTVTWVPYTYNATKFIFRICGICYLVGHHELNHFNGTMSSHVSASVAACAPCCHRENVWITMPFSSLRHKPHPYGLSDWNIVVLHQCCTSTFLYRASTNVEFLTLLVCNELHVSYN